MIVDPSVHHLKNKDQFSHKLVVVSNCNQNEFIYSALVPLGKTLPLDLQEIETVIGITKEVCESIHQYILEESEKLES